MKTSKTIRDWRRGLLASGAALALLWGSVAAAAEPARDKDALMAQIRQAIETGDYDLLKGLVFWKGAGKIKERVVRFQLHRNLGREIASMAWEEFPDDGMDAIVATGKLEPNMKMTHAVRVVFDEEPIAATGRPPTTVFLVGKRGGAYRIGLVVRKGTDDDGD